MKLKFMNKVKYFVLASCLIILAGIGAGFIFGGLNLGIDFTGGTIYTVNMGGDFTDQDVSDALTANGVDISKVQIVHATDSNGEHDAVIRMQEIPEPSKAALLRENILATLQEKYPNAQAKDIETVGGVTSNEIVMNAFLSVIIASVLMLVYIWIRFTLFSGIAGVAALIHDVLIMTAFVSISRLQINSSYIAACLTIVGYSINDTIVVFDRIRENIHRASLKDLTRWEIADLSIRETIPRTINTSLTTLITIAAVYVFGVQSIKEFALPIIIGLLSGTYSSIFIASPIWMALANWKEKRDKKSGKYNPAQSKV